MRIRRKHIIAAGATIGLAFLATRSWAALKTANAATSLLWRFALGTVRPDWAKQRLLITVRGTFTNTRNTPIPIKALALEYYTKGKMVASTAWFPPAGQGTIQGMSSSTLEIPVEMTAFQLTTLFALYGKNLIQVAKAALFALAKKQPFKAGLQVDIDLTGYIVTIDNIRLPLNEKISFGL